MRENPHAHIRSRLERLRSICGMSTEGPHTALAIVVGRSDNAIPENQKNVAMNLHLLNHSKVVDASLIVVEAERMQIFSEEDNSAAPFLGELAADPTADSFPIKYVTFKASDTQALFRTTFEPIKEFLLVKRELEIQQGPLADAFREFLRLHHPASVQEAAPKCTQALTVKDAAAIDAMRNASSFASAIMKSYAFPTIEEIMLQDEDDAPYLASALASDIERTISNPRHIRGLENINSDVYGIALAPVRLHIGGGKIEIISDVRVQPKDKSLTPETIVLFYAVRYRGYAAYIGRTILFNATEAEKNAYASLVSLMGYFTSLLVPDAIIAECWKKAREWYTERHAQFAPYLGATGGFGLGLEILSSASWLSEKNQRLLQPGVAFAVRLVLEDVLVDEIGPFSVLFAETIVVQPAPHEGAEILTSDAPFELEEVSRRVSRHDAEDIHNDDSVEDTRVHTRASSRTNKGANMYLEQSRREIQNEIIAKKKEMAGQTHRERAGPGEVDHSEIARLARGELNLNFPHGGAEDLKAFYAKHLSAQTPTVHAYYNIVLDSSREVLLLPNLTHDGSVTVVHVCTIKNVEIKAEHGERSASPGALSLVFRILFHAANEGNAAFLMHPNAAFIKELSLRISFATDSDSTAQRSQAIVQNMQSLVSLIKLTQTAIVNREEARRTQADVQEQTGLIFARVLDNARLLRDVRCWPNPRVTASGRSTSARQGALGTVEVHENGIRFMLRDVHPLVVLFSNIATAIFQPADNDQRIVFHLHLKQNILVGRKKVRDVQFYLEVTDESEGVGARGRGASWEDEYEAEEAERQRTARLNSEFLHFARGFEKAFGAPVEAPIRKFYFFGTHDKAMVKFKGSEETLFSLTEAPPFVQNMRDVEIVVFERVTALKTNFDLTFVRADFTSVAINNIEHKFLDRVKDWLNDASAKYYEVAVNLVWRTILKEVKADQSWDPWGDEGWDSILRQTDSEAESDASAGSDSSFVMSASESEDSDDDSTLPSEETSSESEPSESDDDDEDKEEGLDWDELEERAARDDRRRARRDAGSDDEDRRPKRR